ncbi:MAG: methyltransferase [Sphingobacteriales bacterium]|nr:methyltransferase [Sphingobacteriales bacterium]
MLWKKKGKAEDVLGKTVPIPVEAADKRYSALFSMYGQPGKPTEWLLSFGLSCVESAFKKDLSDVSSRIKESIDYINIYPGEHYKLLAAIVEKLQPRVVIELGTHLGYSSLCMKKFMPQDGTVYTFDIIPWTGFEDTILAERDFDSQLVQFTDDLTQPEAVAKHLSLLEQADIIFMDALKDGKQEHLFLDHFSKINFKKKCLFIFDDIRLWNMLDIWYNMNKPKLDLTSFGHWSGTGLVEWN